MSIEKKFITRGAAEYLLYQYIFRSLAKGNDYQEVLQHMVDKNFSKKYENDISDYKFLNAIYKLNSHKINFNEYYNNFHELFPFYSHMHNKIDTPELIYGFIKNISAVLLDDVCEEEIDDECYKNNIENNYSELTSLFQIEIPILDLEKNFNYSLNKLYRSPINIKELHRIYNQYKKYIIYKKIRDLTRSMITLIKNNDDTKKTKEASEITEYKQRMIDDTNKHEDTFFMTLININKKYSYTHIDIDDKKENEQDNQINISEIYNNIYYLTCRIIGLIAYDLCHDEHISSGKPIKVVPQAIYHNNTYLMDFDYASLNKYYKTTQRCIEHRAILAIG